MRACDCTFGFDPRNDMRVVDDLGMNREAFPNGTPAIAALGSMERNRRRTCLSSFRGGSAFRRGARRSAAAQEISTSTS